MKKAHILLLSLFVTLIITKANSQQVLQRPKLVVGIVVDQMRWDYLYRYHDRYAENGGFKRLLSGFSCENTMIPYMPALTACGHASIYTGSVPAINGITGNDWWEYSKNQGVYCTQDDSVKTVGSNTEAGKMSPRNMLVTTICDELRLATNFKSKVIGIALKDRGAILPAGHSANGAYWYDSKTGDWITSSYYMNDLPKWAKDFNGQKLVDKYYGQDWNTLYPLNTYTQSNADNKPYENKPFGAAASGFPYSLKQFATKSYSAILVTPYGNSLTLEMAKAALSGEQLGADTASDFLAISLSTPDYIGHSFGPNSIEAEDDFLRLDKDLGDFLDFLDSKAGKGQYLVFLSADHGAAHAPGFLNEHHIPAGHFDNENVTAALNASLKSKFKKDNLAIGIFNYQVYLDRTLIKNEKMDINAIREWAIDFLSQQTGIDRAFATDAIEKTTLNSKIKSMAANGYNPSRSGDIQLLYKPQWLDDFANGGTTHGLWNPYDTHIPLLWYGWNIKPGQTNRTVYMTDIAPTIAALLHIQMPSGSVGNVIEELLR